MNVELKSVGTYADEEGLHPIMLDGSYDYSELMTIRYEDVSEEFVNALSEEDLFNFNVMKVQDWRERWIRKRLIRFYRNDIL